jgi:hypothetical protein
MVPNLNRIAKESPWEMCRKCARRYTSARGNWKGIEKPKREEFSTGLV